MICEMSSDNSSSCARCIVNDGRRRIEAWRKMSGTGTTIRLRVTVSSGESVESSQIQFMLTGLEEKHSVGCWVEKCEEISKHDCREE